MQSSQPSLELWLIQLQRQGQTQRQRGADKRDSSRNMATYSDETVQEMMTKQCILERHTSGILYQQGCPLLVTELSMMSSETRKKACSCMSWVFSATVNICVAIVRSWAGANGICQCVAYPFDAPAKCIGLKRLLFGHVLQEAESLLTLVVKLVLMAGNMSHAVQVLPLCP